MLVQVPDINRMENMVLGILFLKLYGFQFQKSDPILVLFSLTRTCGSNLTKGVTGHNTGANPPACG
jgi:hypothetical protein